jgi:hypothetical protein
MRAVRAKRAVPREAGWVFNRAEILRARRYVRTTTELCEGTCYRLAFVGVFFASFLFRR